MRLEIFRFRSFCSGEEYGSQKLFILDAILINAAVGITTGVILSGYMLYLGASDFLSALINNSASFSAILCIFSFIFFEKKAKRKKILISMNLLSRTIFMLILAVPFIIEKEKTSFFLIAVLIVLSDVIFSIYRVGWLVWLMDIAPAKNKTNYIYMRMFYLRCAYAFVTLLSGFILDMFDKGFAGFAILFGSSYLLSLMDAIVLGRIREKGYMLDSASKSLDRFLVPLKTKQYRDYLFFMFLFYFSFFISSAYTPVYMIKYLELDYKFILSMSVVSMTAMILSNLMWMKVEQRSGSGFVLSTSTLMQALGLLIIGFLTDRTYYLFFFSSVITGVGAGGFNTTSFSYRYELMPDVGKTIYESWFYLIFGVASLIAPIAGQMVINIMPEFTNTVFHNSKIQLLYMVSFALLCLSAISASRVKKKEFIKTS